MSIYTDRLAALRDLARKVDAEIAFLAESIGKPVRTPGGKRPRWVIPECGTETAYQRHYHRGEPIDEACRLAHNAHFRARYQRRKAR